MTHVVYSTDLSRLVPEQVRGFHSEWSYKYPADRLLDSMRESEWTIVAMVEDAVVGYASVIGDGRTFAFLTSIEVRPEYRGQGIGTRLLDEAVAKFKGRYAFDLLCDEDVADFYAARGFSKVTGMCRRNIMPDAS